MEDNKHVLFITSWYPSPKRSAGTFIELHLLALQSRGCKCAVLLNSEVTLGNFVKAGANKSTFLDFRRRPDITFIDNLTIHSLPLRMAKDPIEKRKSNILTTTVNNIKVYIAKHGKPDVIFHHGVFDFCYLTSHVAQFFDIPIWYMENSPNMTDEKMPCANPFDTRETQMAFAQNADRRFAVTEAYVEKMNALFQTEFELCPNVITDDFFIDADNVKKSKDIFQFINVAILDERKNQRLILEAFAKNYRGDEKFSLVIAGDGLLLAPLRELAIKLGIEKQAKILGYQNRGQIIDLLDASHCFVLASHSETFGVVVIEAMARGIPAISSRIDGTKEIFNADNGVLFEPNSLEDLAAKMNQVVENYSTFEPRKIIDSVKSNYGPDAVYNALYPND